MLVQKFCALDSLIEAYKQYQRVTRGLAEPTLSGYARILRQLVRMALGEDPIDPVQLQPCDVVQFVASMQSQFSAGSMKTVTKALRSFFRFLHVEGLCDERLEAAVPTVAHWQRASVPRHLSDTQLDQLLGSLDLCKPCGYRDRAMISCLGSLGLRPGEVAALRLEDIDWRQATVHLRRLKVRRVTVLPLPCEAGQAIAAYLQGHRPETDERCIFVQQLGRRRGAPLSSDAVSVVVTRALRRAGIEIPIAGAYVLRHTFASRMVRRGASLKEVADLLGHKSLDTTMIYAKLDLEALREVALPWPQVVR